MTFETYLQEQLILHPSMQAQDVVKMCYQAANGAEHLLVDVSAAEGYFYAEFDAVEPSGEPLAEPISDAVCRVNLAAWKAKGMAPAWLWYMFSHTAVPLRLGEPILEEYLDIASRVLNSAGFDAYADAYKREGMPAVHHSDAYRKAEKPAYRIVSRHFAPVFPILERIAAVHPRVIAIDGRAAAGKSTAAAYLADIVGAPVVHMDDFFLPPALRTDARLAEAGGNVHYERFSEEVLPHLQSGEAFSYRVFDCGKMALSGTREIAAAPCRIVEGAYSCHPYFGNYADLRVFFDVDPETQMQRIVARNGAEMAETFQKRWIPMEERYHKTCHVKETADLVIKI